MSPRIRVYRATMCLYQRGFATDRALSGHPLEVTGADEPCTPGWGGSDAGA